MSEVDDLISQFSGYTEAYSFYNGSVRLRFEPKSHVYYLETPHGLIAQDGVSSVVKVIDKSDPLMNWAVKIVTQRILDTVPKVDYALPNTPNRTESEVRLSYAEFEALVLAAKSAHKDKLDDAGAIGKLAHAWIESLIKADLSGDLNRKQYLLNTLPEDYQAANCCEAAVDWMSFHNIRWVHTEKKVYSRRFGFAGTMDGLCIADSCTDEKCCKVAFKDHLTLVDWKTSNQLNIEYLLQTAAYQYAYQEEHGTIIKDRWVIRLGKEDGEFSPWHVPHMADDFDAFRHALELKRSLEVISARIKERDDELKALRKEEKKEAREEALAIKCYRADTYKAVRRPRCGPSGTGCETCRAKYRDRHEQT